MTEEDGQSVARMKGFLSSVTGDFTKYHFMLIDSIENEDEAPSNLAGAQTEDHGVGSLP